MKDIEIEFKALLTKELYDKILSEVSEYEQSSHVNHYFDTEDELLKENNMALRIRIKDHCNQLTIKRRVEDENSEYYEEISDFLGACETRRLIEEKQLESEVLIEYLNENNVEETKFSNYNVFTTNRIFCKLDGHTLFLDETTFANGVVDYELEVEAKSYEECENHFDFYKNKYNLERSFKHKIERAVNNKS